MNVNVSDLKSQYADLKYEQLLADKYFVETCFSKKFNSYSSKEKLRDLEHKISAFSFFHEESITVECFTTPSDCTTI